MANNDVYVPQNTIDKLLTRLGNDAKIGAIGPTTNNAGGYRAQEIPGATTIDSFADEEYTKLEVAATKIAIDNKDALLSVKWLTGCFMIMKNEAFKKSGGIDVSYGLAYHEESDLMVRMRRLGYELIVDKSSFVYHGDSGALKLMGASMRTVFSKALYSFLKNSVYFIYKNGVGEMASLFYNWHIRKHFESYT